jgi:xylulokinase
MEGVAFLLKKNIAYLEGMHIGIKDLISLGGGARSEVWSQIKADVTGKEIRLPEYEEATSLGAAILAAVDCGFVTGVQEAVHRCIRMKRVFVPTNQGMYSEGYEKFLMLYDKLTPVFHYG